MELISLYKPLRTDVGELTAVLMKDISDDVWTAYIEEYPAVITQSDSIEVAMARLPVILDLFFEVQIKHLMND